MCGFNIGRTIRHMCQILCLVTKHSYADLHQLKVYTDVERRVDGEIFQLHVI